MILPFLNVVYLTNRRDPCFAWFTDSFHRECGGDYSDIKVIVVDFYADQPGRREQLAKVAHCPITHIPPKPTVWQGPHRLTSVDYFAASNARNTGLCVSHDGYIAFVDDISILMPDWLAEVRNAMRIGFVACGTYQKVLNLVVENGNVVSFDDHPSGHDVRLEQVKTDNPTRCGGGWCWGASLAVPTEALFKINAYDEDCDSMASEDYICGLMLEANGYELCLCPRMRTLESEERHFIDPPFKRIIKKGPTPEDIDASHRILNMVRNGRHRAPNYADMRELRQKVLFENQPFPTNQNPRHDWRDGQPLSEM